jgi:multidrug efflux pump subunit AcrA (membrane-fusion protein)
MIEYNDTVLEAPVLPPARLVTPARSRRGRGAALCLAALTGIGAAVYLGIHSRLLAEAEAQRVALDTVAAPVQAIHPQKGSKAEEIALPGNTQAFSATAIYARTSGYLKSWSVDIGARVKQDQVLAEIETPEVDQQLEQAEADLKNAQANLEISQITAARWETLYKKDTVSHQERVQAASDFAAKKALVIVRESVRAI